MFQRGRYWGVSKTTEFKLDSVGLTEWMGKPKQYLYVCEKRSLDWGGIWKGLTATKSLVFQLICDFDLK